MAFLYSKIPTQCPPRQTYKILDGTYVKPAGRSTIADYPIKGSSQIFDMIFFVTKGENQEDHFRKLKDWIMFHCFIFNDIHPCYFFEDKMLANPEFARYLEIITNFNDELPSNQCDYNNIGNQVYWLYNGEIPTISYHYLFEKYISLTDENRSFINNYLLYLNADRVIYPQYDLFSAYRKYWQTVKNVVLLETIIGHAPSCINIPKICCLTCQKGQISYPHRSKTEREWRKEYIKNVTNDERVTDAYLKVINIAFNEIRNITAHTPINPTSKRVEQIRPLEIYGIDRTIEEFKSNNNALLNLGILVAEITRYLLLNKLFMLSVFPIPKNLNVYSYGYTKA